VVLGGSVSVGNSEKWLVDGTFSNVSAVWEVMPGF
jgi:hypothetical protein